MKKVHAESQGEQKGAPDWARADPQRNHNPFTPHLTRSSFPTLQSMENCLPNTLAWNMQRPLKENMKVTHL